MDQPLNESPPAEGAAVPPAAEPAAKGVRVLTADSFSLDAAVGGVRGIVESTMPGLVFVVVFVASGQRLTPALVASVAVALVAVVARLVQRTPLTQALGGTLGVAIGVIWAWRSGEASNYFVWGLWTNAIYLAGLVVSLLVRWPAVGLVVEGLRGFTGDARREEPEHPTADVVDAVPAGDASALDVDAAPAWSAWRSDAPLVHRYVLATWLWVAMFAVRLVVQVPLYLADQVGWLGTARLVMGVPLFALTLWATWVLVRRPAAAALTPSG